MTIKLKILIPSIIMTVIAIVAILLSNIIQFSDYVNASLEDRVFSASNVLDNNLKTLKAEANSVSMTIAEDAAIVDAVSRGDREAIIARANVILIGTGMEFCSISDSTGIAIARTHAPEKFGDDITGMPTVRSALAGEPLVMVEPGVSVRMSACAGVPIIDRNDVLVGTVVTGVRLDTNTFVDSMKELLNCEVTVFLGDERISTTVLDEAGNRATGTKASQNVIDTVLKGQTFTGRTQIIDQEALTRYSPIFNPDGSVLGMLFVGQYMTEETSTINGFILVGCLVALAVLAAAVPSILIVAGRIVLPIKSAVKAANALAEGNTDINLTITTKDEVSELAHAFNEMIENTRAQVQIIKAIADGDYTVKVDRRSENDEMNHMLSSMLDLNSDIFSRIIASAGQVSAGARQMADSSQSLAEGATEQAATVQELTDSMSEVHENTKISTDMAGRAATLGDKIRDSAQKGTEQMGRMVQAVKDINEANQSISKIIKVIDDIAFQTNILAINASVEAAHAGESGKGFAVVADEVRSLAAKSAEAAKDTGTLIENTILKADLGTRIADETAESLNEIVEGINESGRLVGDIAEASSQQSSIIDQINDGIHQLNQVVLQNSATAQENAAVSEEMSGQAEFLQGLVSRFKLGEPTKGQTLNRTQTRSASRSVRAPSTGSGIGKY